MSRNKQKQKNHKNISQSIASRTANGLKAFRQNDFEKAILFWEREPAKLRPVALLAEAHFRRGLVLFYGSDSQTGMSHLQTAASYLPNDACYAYHVGLALHRLGNLPGALGFYETARQTPGLFATRAAYPLVLVLLQNGQDPTTTSAWYDLTVAEQALLRSVNNFRRRPYTLPPEAPLLLRALAALDNNDNAQAQAGLEKILAVDATAAEKNVANYYLGVLAARAEDWDTARRAWDAAFAAGLRSARLQSNLAEIYQRLAEDLLIQDDAQTALAAAEEAKRHLPGNSDLDELLAQIHQQLGYQSANANRWDEAKSHWQTAVELDSTSFRLVYNLALAYEKLGNNISAGQTWREALRRRPRRPDHPDVLSDDEVAQVWQRAAECYRKAGEFDQVKRTYQQAIKWAPDNLDLRLALAESLIKEGHLQSARNELEQVLKRNPKHVQALIRLGEAYFRDERSPWYVKEQAKKPWEKALQIEPKNSKVQQVLAEWYVDQAEIDFSWDRYAEAAENYQKALEYQPKNINTLVSLAGCYIKLEDESRGEEYASQALAQAANFDDFATIISFWLRVGSNKRAWEITSQAEERFRNVPTDFYIDLAQNLIKAGRKDEVQPWLQRAVEKAAPEESVFVMIADMAMDIDIPLAMNYLQKALDAKQMLGLVHLMMGILEYEQNNKPASRKHFNEAERIAYQTKDTDLANRLDAARLVAQGPDAIMRQLMDIGDPDLLNEFLNDFGEEFV
jgi:tetratricopeptide (TPR) repeat protein